MKFGGIFKKIFSFDVKYDQFELLETEQGAPGAPQPKSRQAKAKPGPDTVAAQSNIKEGQALSGTFADDCALMDKALNLPENKDVIVRKFKIRSLTPACVYYMSGMAKAELVNDFILRQSMSERKADKDISIDDFCQNIAAIAEFSLKSSAPELVYDVLSGLAVVLIAGENRAAAFETRGFVHRSVESPKSEKSIKGPHEGFTESIRDNITLVRRLVKTSDLVAEYMPLGGNNNISCAVLYRKGFSNEKLVDKIKTDIKSVKTNYVLGEGVLGQLSGEKQVSFLPQQLVTERPDRAAAMLMEGHVALVCEGTPFAQVAPATFGAMMTSPDDHYMSSINTSISRIVRIIGVFLTVFLPALYVAAVKFHQSIISTEMMNTILIARRTVTFPVELELLLMLAIFQIVKEAGLRVPGEFGQSISVVAALVLGQASVAAKFTSSVMLIIVALSVLGNYSIPDTSLQFGAVVLQITLIIAASLAGFYGISLYLAVIITYLFSVKSYGVPFFAPFAPKAYKAYSFLDRGKQRVNVEPQDITNTEKDQ